MTLVLGDLDIALPDAGASEGSARKAAAEVLAATRPPARSTDPLRAADTSVTTLVLVYMTGIATGLTAALFLLP